MANTQFHNGFLIFSVCASALLGASYSDTVPLRGNTRPAVMQGMAQEQGRVRGSQRMPRMSLHFTMTPAQSADLAQLLIAQQDRRSPQYHKFLTPEEYAARFGVSQSAIANVWQWLEEQGFSHLQVARSATWVSFAGTAAQAEAAFHISIHHYSLRGETYFANANDPELPKEFESLVGGVRGLHNFAMRPFIRSLHPQFTSSISGNHFLTPDDWATIYDVQPLYGAGVDGTGVTIAVVGQSDVALSDIRAFRAAAGLPAKDPAIVIPPGSTDPGIRSGDETESDLDLEWAGGVAKNANILFVTANATTGNGVFDAITYAIDNNVAPIMTISYGLCEADVPTADFNTQNGLYQQASAQGMTVLVASGDAGAATCDAGLTEFSAMHGLAVAFPASSQYVTGVGGTELADYDGTYWALNNNANNGSALSYIPEIVWNDGFQSAAGGGASKLITKPTWQTGAGVPADSARDVPDVAFTASANHDGLLICHEGSCTNGFRNSSNNSLYVAGGTSAAAPAFAGVLALVLQKGGVTNRLGNINTNLYSLAQISNNAFHDVTAGNNQQTCAVGTTDCPNGYLGFYAGAGYDLASGLGSVDAYNFAEQWFGDFTISASPNTLTLQPGSSTTATVTLTPQNNFAGNVTVTCSVASVLVDVTCSVPATAVNGAGGTATVTITAASTARLPFWKPRPSLPPLHRNWLLLMLGTVVMFAGIYALRKQPSFSQYSAYSFSSVSLLAIAIGAVSCGGGGSSGPAPVAVAQLAVSCNLPGATFGTAYSGSCAASGGSGPYAYTINNGNLPPGLTISAATGVVNGTPTSTGNYLFNVSVSDNSNPVQIASQANQTVSVVASVVTLTCKLPAAQTGAAYSGSCVGTGGIPPLSYNVTGSMPVGLGINAATGAVTGTPLIPGISTFSLAVKDYLGQTATVAFPNFTVAPGPLTLSCTLPGSAITGAGYGGTCSTNGGTPPIVYSISSGALPAGLNLGTFSSPGTNYVPPVATVIGSPTVAGTNSFTVKASDGGTPKQTATQTAGLVVTAGPLSLHCSIFWPTNVNAVYNGACTAFGGSAPLGFSVSAGALPAGLSLNSSTGVVSGVPTNIGTSSFTMKVTDSSTPASSATQAFNGFTVVAAPAFTLTCYQQLAHLGNYYLGGCTPSGGNPPYTAAVTGGTLPPGIVLESGGQFDGTPTAVGTYTQTITATDSTVPPQKTSAPTTITVGPRLPETGLVTITATSGGIVNTTTISVTVP